MNNKICDAINSKSLMQFHYKGGIRKIEPYCYGRGTSGNELLRGFQTEGFSESGNQTGWKLFKVKDITEIKILDEEFKGDRKGYNPKDPAMKQIFCGVEKENID